MVAFALSHSYSYRVLELFARIIIANMCRPFVPQFSRQSDVVWPTVLVWTYTYLDLNAFIDTHTRIPDLKSANTHSYTHTFWHAYTHVCNGTVAHDHIHTHTQTWLQSSFCLWWYSCISITITLTPPNKRMTYPWRPWGLSVVMFFQNPKNKRQFAIAVVTSLLVKIGVTEPSEHVVKKILFSNVFCATFICVPALGEMSRSAFGLLHSRSHTVMIHSARKIIANVCRPFAPQLERQVDLSLFTVLVRTDATFGFLQICWHTLLT